MFRALLQDLTKALVLPDELFCQEFFSLNELITLLDEDFFRRHHNEGQRPAANLKFVRQYKCRDACDPGRKCIVKSNTKEKVQVRDAHHESASLATLEILENNAFF